MTEDTNLGNINQTIDNESNEFNNTKKCKICQIPIFKGQKIVNACLCGEQHEECLKKRRYDLFSFFECRDCKFTYLIKTKKKDTNDSHISYLWMILFDNIFIIFSVLMMKFVFSSIYIKVNEIRSNSDNPDYNFSRSYNLKCNIMNPLVGDSDSYFYNTIDCAIIHPMIRLVEWFLNHFIIMIYNCFFDSDQYFSICLSDFKYWDVIVIALTFILHSAILKSFQYLLFLSIKRSFYIINLIINKETGVIIDNAIAKKQD
jgi:hypothetical protein